MLFQNLEHLVSHQLGDVGPDVDNLVVTLTICDQPLAVLLFDLDHLVASFFDQDLLVLRDYHVVNGYRDARKGSVAETNVLQVVQEGDRPPFAGPQVALVDQIGQRPLAHGTVNHTEGDLIRHYLIENHPADCGCNELTIYPKPNPRLQSNLPMVVGYQDLLHVTENKVLPFGGTSLLG